MITEKTFVDGLKTVTQTAGDEWLADMAEYALSQARQGNWQPLNALANVMAEAKWGARFSEAMFAIGLFALVKREKLKEPAEWRGIALLYRLVPRDKARDPETGAILENSTAVNAAIKALLAAVDRQTLLEKIGIYREEQATKREEKAAELRKNRGSVKWWLERTQKLLDEAEKCRMPIAMMLETIVKRYGYVLTQPSNTNNESK